MLRGLPGSGTTRLAAEFTLEAAGARTATRLQGSAAGRLVPFGVLGPLLDVVDEPGGPLRSGAREHAATALSGADLRSVAAAVVEASRRGDIAGERGLVFLDDADLCDDASALVLLQLVASAQVDLIVAARSTAPLPAGLQQLTRSGLALRVQVDPLDAAAVAELGASRVGMPLTAATQRAVGRWSAGSPTAVIAMLDAALDGGQLVEENGVAHLRSIPAAPPGLVERVREELEPLDRGVLDLLDAVALAEPVPPKLFGRLADRLIPSGDPVAIELLEVRRLIESDDAGSMVIGPGLPALRAVLVDSMPSSRRRRLASELLTVTAAVEAPVADAGEWTPVDAVRRGTWALDAGLEVDPNLLLQGSRVCRSRGDFDRAERFARAALAAGGRFEHSYELGEVPVAAKRHAAAEEALVGVDAIADGDEEVALAAMLRSSNLFFGLTRPDAAIECLDAAIRRVGAEWQPELAGLASSFELFSGRPAAAWERVAPVVARVEGAADAQTGVAAARGFVEAALIGAPALAVVGRCEEAASLAAEGLRAREAMGVQPIMSDGALHLAGRATALALAGELDAALDVVEQGHRLVADRTPEARAWVALVAGRVLLARGAVSSADRWFREAAALFEGEIVGPRRWAMAGIVLANASLGRSHVCTEVIEGCPEPDPISFMGTEFLIARAWSAWLDGDEAQSHELLERAGSCALETGQFALGGEVAHDMMRLRAEHAAAALLRQVEPHVGGPLTVARCREARAAVAADPHECIAAGDAYAEMGAMLFAAEASARAAQMLELSGERRAAAAERRRCVDRRSSCEDAQTPLLESGSRSLLLTAREHEVARAAARGATSKEIALDLGVSRRTVDNLLQRAFDKLGVRRRSELPDALSDDDV